MEFDFVARLAELIDEALDPVKAVSQPLSYEQIIDFLEEAALTLQVKLLKSGGSQR
jgi:hypothetical protein